MTDILDRIRKKATKQTRSIVLPESQDARILRASCLIKEHGIATPILIGNKKNLNTQAKRLDIDITTIDIIDPDTFNGVDDLSKLLVAIYQAKNKSIDDKTLNAQLYNPLYFSALLVKSNIVDGCVAGAANTTAEVLRAAFSVLGTKAGIKTISGAIIIVLPKRIFVFADCAVVPEPTIEQLADIAISSAQTVKTLLGTTAKIAMLSFSTYGSAKHSLSEKIAKTTQLIKQKNPNLIIDGELQLDAAIVPEIAKLKAPNSAIKGDANVLIFPGLEAGNIAYKLAQRLASAQAIGPILQGIAQPMNDLSRGASVEDIVNMAAITSIQSHTTIKAKY